MPNPVFGQRLPVFRVPDLIKNQALIMMNSERFSTDFASDMGDAKEEECRYDFENQEA